MAGKSGFRSYPKHLGKPTGVGLRQCAATSFLRHEPEMMQDFRQGIVAPDFADITPGFETYHPQDVVQLGALDDPKPVVFGNSPDPTTLSMADRGWTDADVLASIKGGYILLGVKP